MVNKYSKVWGSCFFVRWSRGWALGGFLTSWFGHAAFPASRRQVMCRISARLRPMYAAISASYRSDLGRSLTYPQQDSRRFLHTGNKFSASSRQAILRLRASSSGTTAAFYGVVAYRIVYGSRGTRRDVAGRLARRFVWQVIDQSVDACIRHGVCASCWAVGLRAAKKWNIRR